MGSYRPGLSICLIIKSAVGRAHGGVRTKWAQTPNQNKRNGFQHSLIKTANKPLSLMGINIVIFIYLSEYRKILYLFIYLFTVVQFRWSTPPHFDQ